MNSELDSISSAILASPDIVAKLRILDRGDLKIELWHIVAEIAGARYKDMPDDAPIPDIRKLTDAVFQIVIAALGKCTNNASTA